MLNSRKLEHDLSLTLALTERKVCVWLEDGTMVECSPPTALNHAVPPVDLVPN